MIVGIIIAVSIIIVDQVTKYFLYGITTSLIGDFLWLEEAFNTGASFGMFKNGTIFFIIISTPLIGVMIWLLVSKNKNITNYLKACIGVLLGGTLGNYFDRIFLGGVRDFIYFKSIDFAIFNMADVAITVGTIMIAVYLVVDIIKDLKNGKKEKEMKTKEKKEENESNINSK